MSTKRKAPLPQNSRNFRSAPGMDAATSGTRPVAKPSSVQEVLTMMVLYVCKKTIFFDINLKVALYLGSLFLISLIGDFSPYPRTYFARSDNLFNVYFVKMGWMWTLIFSGPFLFLTNLTLGIGNREKMIKNHLLRLFIATGFWFVWTKFFNIIESSYGRCNVRTYESKSNCLKAGNFWSGFDISGHAFILIYSSLVLIEEARPINGWDNIKEYLQNEEYNRKMRESAPSSNPLRNLKNEELSTLKYLYFRYTPAIRLLFVGMTVLQVLWDVMLVCTMLYYHRMIEKVISGIVAIVTWFITYRVWYPSTAMPDLPGKCSFNYQNKIAPIVPLKRNSSLTNQHAKEGPPRFMGMPIFTGKSPTQQQSDLNIENTISNPGKYDFQPPSPKFL